jgi:hypothetical protein
MIVNLIIAWCSKRKHGSFQQLEHTFKTNLIMLVLCVRMNPVESLIQLTSHHTERNWIDISKCPGDDESEISQPIQG